MTTNLVGPPTLTATELPEPGRQVGCRHSPHCPAFGAPDHDAAHAVAFHPEQGWTLLCNGVVVFDDTGEILPNGVTVAPHRPRTRRPVAL